MTWRSILIAAALALSTATVRAAEREVFPAPAGERGRIVVRGATDLSAIRPLILDFQRLRPDVTVDYHDYVTNDLFEEAAEACRADRPHADLLLSSAVDHLVELANRGCAAPHRSGDAAALSSWAKWRDEVFGFTLEPAVIVYNKKLLAPELVPASHHQLAEILRTHAGLFRGRVGTYDIRLSGVGYLYAFFDLLQTGTTYGRLLESMGRVGTVLRCCTDQVLEGVARGELLIGYNLLGSYAYGRMRQGAPIGIVLPRDYTLVLARGAMIPRRSSGGDGGIFLDYLLSPRGQEVGRAEAFFFSADGGLPPGVEGPASILGSGAGRPIAIGPALLLTQDRMRRTRFIADWSRSMIDMNVEGGE
ncbi:ABC transporter substrate-binding protein [Pinisolibacter sp.]|uniref:ABC transporter substrate-binding protein n=1 Tax=Pinisolibacter sp. TaxID=2172024 RepID=UPI002FDD4BEC